MRYRNDRNTGGVTIDGVPDPVALGPLTWEQVSGAQGTFTVVHRIDATEPGLTWTSFYADDATPDFVQCTGDGKAIGTSGPSLEQGTAETDPRRTPHFDLTHFRTQYHDAPNQNLAAARHRSAWAASPLSATAARWTG